jgi:hypothetical protein
MDVTTCLPVADIRGITGPSPSAPSSAKCMGTLDSSWTAWPWKWRYYCPLKRGEWHGVNNPEHANLQLLGCNNPQSSVRVSRPILEWTLKSIRFTVTCSGEYCIHNYRLQNGVTSNALSELWATATLWTRGLGTRVTIFSVFLNQNPTSRPYTISWLFRTLYRHPRSPCVVQFLFWWAETQLVVPVRNELWDYVHLILYQ